MPLSMYQASVPPLLQLLNSLSAILDKAQSHCTARKIDPAVILTDRLYPDMFAFTRQVQIATDHAKGMVARLAGADVPVFADDEKSFDDLKRRLAKTIDFVSGFTAAQIDGSEEKHIAIKIGSQEKEFSGQNYLIHFALPNFYFHVTTAYDILRHDGIDVGKKDFIGSY